jgi:hypothetical protein
MVRNPPPSLSIAGPLYFQEPLSARESTSSSSCDINTTEARPPQARCLIFSAPAHGKRPCRSVHPRCFGYNTLRHKNSLSSPSLSPLLSVRLSGSRLRCLSPSSTQPRDIYLSVNDAPCSDLVRLTFSQETAQACAGRGRTVWTSLFASRHHATSALQEHAYLEVASTLTCRFHM